MAKGWWEGYWFNGSCFDLALKLKVLQEDLKDSNKGILGNIAACKAHTLDHINYWDGKKREGSLSLEDRESRRLALEEFNYWPYQRKPLGGKNQGRCSERKGTKRQLFHKMVNARHRKNLIGRTRINGEWVTKEVEISSCELFSASIVGFSGEVETEYR